MDISMELVARKDVRIRRFFVLLRYPATAAAPPEKPGLFDRLDVFADARGTRPSVSPFDEPRI
jgi:hypothetical protein